MKVEKLVSLATNTKLKKAFAIVLHFLSYLTICKVVTPTKTLTWLKGFQRIVCTSGATPINQCQRSNWSMSQIYLLFLQPFNNILNVGLGSDSSAGSQPVVPFLVFALFSQLGKDLLVKLTRSSIFLLSLFRVFDLLNLNQSTIVFSSWKDGTKFKICTTFC